MNKDRSLLTDAQWGRLSPLLPGQEHSPGTTARDTRLFVEAVLWQAGVWPRVLAQVQNAMGLHQLMVDSTAVRAHQVAAGAKKKTAPSARRSAAAGAVSPPSST